ncbi:MAG: FeS assembly scaffold SufA [Candidatus Liberibacter europaeus]|uniref:FeS assembly scaffold SufA n=1 Tax=Candidatus Liberibacter europaeus TaxID=744859 RepID=A0A2T4VX18_9HYPH|nr:FeS assembly scaffold SufA [Candidatus Liberibacter europaeus]PTL86322.1 MAG: FeS assembly scaffold SufA [Candidatus Liberibacter europaeus]
MISADIITVTEDAISRIKDIVKDSGKNAQGIRISLKKSGCAGLEYVVDLVTNPLDGDNLLEKNDVKIWIDPSALLYIFGMEIDFEETKLRSGFIFHNPNQISSCGCGKSVELKHFDLEKNYHDKSR